MHRQRVERPGLNQWVPGSITAGILKRSSVPGRFIGMLMLAMTLLQILNAGAQGQPEIHRRTGRY
jgi:hypothetical protein